MRHLKERTFHSRRLTDGRIDIPWMQKFAGHRAPSPKAFSHPTVVGSSQQLIDTLPGPVTADPARSGSADCGIVYCRRPVYKVFLLHCFDEKRALNWLKWMGGRYPITAAIAQRILTFDLWRTCASTTGTVDPALGQLLGSASKSFRPQQ
jgi:hypothetical protein